MRQVEIERKYIIEMPDMARLREISGYEVTEIVQTYLLSEEGVTRRVRKRSYPERTEYTETVKIRIDKMSAEEREREISKEEYSELLKEMKPGTRPIKKHRHSFPFGDITVEIDVYPEWERSCIMETELVSCVDAPPLPPFIRIIREVTGERGYSNADMAHAFPKESL